MTKATLVKNGHISPDARLYVTVLEALALTASPRVQASLLRIHVPRTVRFRVPPFVRIFFFFFMKNPLFEMTLAEAHRELLRGSLPEAVLFRLGCPGQPITRNLGDRAPLLCRVAFDSLKRSRTSLLSRAST